MTIDEKTALARIVSDMIKADNIIERSEIIKFKKLKDQLGLDKVLMDARSMKFSEAITIAKNYAHRQEVFDTIMDMSLADGLCVPREALLLLALRYAMRRSTTHKVEFFSCPIVENSLCDNYVVYVESEENEAFNTQIKSQFEDIVNIFKISGFDFIFIPQLVSEFREMEPCYVKDVIAYMAPELQPDSIEKVYDKLSRMSTVDFCKNVLGHQLGIEEMYNVKPSLLINIGSSFVPRKSDGMVVCYTEFMCLNIEKDVKQEANDLLKEYKNFIHNYYSCNVPIRENPGSFKYFGFYKALLDFLLVPPVGESDVIICPQVCELRFPGIGRTIKLTPTECATYVLMAVESFTGDMLGVSTNPKSSVMKRYDEIFKSVYFSARENNTYFQQLNSNKCRIITKLHSLDILKNVDKYIPVKETVDGQNYFRLRTMPSSIKLKSCSLDRYYTIDEYGEWCKHK